MGKKTKVIDPTKLYSQEVLFGLDSQQTLKESDHPVCVSLRESVEKRPILRKRLIQSEDIMNNHASIKNSEFLHSVLCQVAMPRSKTDERTFQRVSGGVFMELEAGKLFLGGKMVEQPLPYGAKPRLVMIHITTEAIRTQNPIVEVGKSVHEFLQKLGLDDNGRSYKAFNAQIQALAASRLTLGMNFGGKDVTVHTNPIKKFEAWIGNNEKQSAMWPGTMELSQDFFESIQEFAVPLDGRALRALSNSALALDIYTWLAYRLCQIKKPEGISISWAALQSQFGQEYTDMKNFKKEFKRLLFQVGVFYEQANFEFDDKKGGLILKPSLPPIPKKSFQVLLPNNQQVSH